MSGVTTSPSSVAAALWDGHTADQLRHLCGVPRLELLTETTSTQDIAHALAEGGAPAGTTVLADAQIAGRGRLGRSWMSESGRGVWCTVIERPSDASAMDVMSLRVGLHCAEALDAYAGNEVGVKWPNDLVMVQVPRRAAARDDAAVIPGETRNPHSRKLGGILIEARWTGASLGWVAIGVGVNVHPPAEVPDAVGLAPDTKRVAVLAGIVRAVRAAAAVRGPLTADELARYRARDALIGRTIRSPEEGTVAGIAPDGALVVDTATGTRHVRSGTVEIPEAHKEST